MKRKSLFSVLLATLLVLAVAIPSNALISASRWTMTSKPVFAHEGPVRGEEAVVVTEQPAVIIPEKLSAADPVPVAQSEQEKTPAIKVETPVAGISIQKAKEIMGKNFFGREEAEKHFGVEFSPEQLSLLAEIPWPEAVLKECKDTHVLVLNAPLSIKDLLVKAAVLFEDQTVYDRDEKFFWERGKVSWNLVRKHPITKSEDKNWAKQTALLPSNEEVPAAQLLVYSAVAHYLNTGERMFHDVYVRSSSSNFGKKRIEVGFWEGQGSGIEINDVEDYTRDKQVGLASARKR